MLTSDLGSSKEPRAFASRLSSLISPRRRTPWGANLLIPSGTMTRMFTGDGIPPTYETLQKIARTENVNLSWLLGERVPRYNIAHCGPDDVLADELHARLSEESSWQVSMLISTRHAIFVLSQPAQIEEKRGVIDYTAVEVLTGAVGDTSAWEILGSPDRLHAAVFIDEHPMAAALQHGVGTFQLFGDDSHAGLIPRHRNITPIRVPPKRQRSSELLMLKEETTGYPEADRTMIRLIDAWRFLNQDERKALDIVLAPLLAQASKRP